MEWVKIIGMSLSSTLGYGLLHNLITGQLCSAYFTRFHPPLAFSVGALPTALVWAVLSTWWIGSLLGVLLAAVARLGKAPTFGVAQIWPCLRWLGLIMASTAACFAGIAWLISFQGGFSLDPTLLLWLPISQHAPCTAVAAAHRTSYSIGILGSLALLLWIARQRGPCADPPHHQRQGVVGGSAHSRSAVLCCSVGVSHTSTTASLRELITSILAIRANLWLSCRRELGVRINSCSMKPHSMAPLR